MKVFGTFQRLSPAYALDLTGGAPSTVKDLRSKIWKKKSGNTPEMLSEQTLNFQSFIRLEIPKSWKVKHIPSPEYFQNCASPTAVGTVSFFGGAPSMEQPELVIEFLTVLGAPLT